MPDPQKNVAFTFDIGLIDTSARPAFKAGPTLATGDWKVSIDNGALANLGTLPVVSPAGGSIVKVVLAQAEMNGDRIAIVGVDAAGAEWDDVIATIVTTTATIDTVKAETALIVADTNELQTDDIPGKLVTLDAVVDTVKAETALIVADTNELQTDDIPGKLVTLDGVVDTVKAETVLILADTAEIGTAGAGLTNINLPDQTMDIAGNLSGSVGSVTGHTVQTGDTYALAAGATGFAAIDTVVDGIQTDLSNGTDGLGAIKTSVNAIPTTAMRGTDSAALASALATAQSDLDTVTGTDGATLATAQGLYAPAKAGDNMGTVSSVTGAVGSVTGHTVQTGDTYALASGATGFAAIDTVVDGIQTDLSNGTDGLGAIKGDTAAVLVDTGTTLDTKINNIQGATFASATDSLEAIRDRGDAAWVTGAGGSDRLLMVDTTIATLASQTSFTLTAGSADDDAYNNCTIVVEDVVTAAQKAVGMVLNYTGATLTVTLKEALKFTIAATDKVYILAENSLKSTVANRQLDVTASGAAGIDWANVENPTTTLDLSSTDIQLADTVTTNSDMRGTNSAALATALAAAQLDLDIVTGADGAVIASSQTVATVTTLTGHTAQTGDSYALANGATGFAAIDAVVDGIQTDLSNGTDGLGAIKSDTAAVLVDTNELQADDIPGKIASLDAVVDTVKAETVLILADTAEIGAAGAGLTNIPRIANVGIASTVVANTDMRGTDAAATQIAASSIQTSVDAIPTTAMRGTDNAALASAVSTLQVGVTAIPTTAMRGTDNASLASSVSTVQVGIDAIPTTAMRGTDSAALQTTASAILTDTAVIGALGAGLTGIPRVANVGNVSTNTDAVTAASIASAVLNGSVSTTASAGSLAKAISDIDQVWLTAMTESYAANGVAMTPAQAMYAIHQLLMQFGIVGTSETVRKLDNTTTAFVVTLDDATSPTDAKRV